MAYSYIRTPDPVYVKTEEEARKWAKRYAKETAVGFDTETTGLSKTGARIKFFSFADETSRICAPVRLLSVFSSVLENPKISKRMTNAKFDMHMVANHGIEIRGTIEDTVSMDWLLDENRIGRHGLKQCSADYLGLRMAPFKDVFGSVGSTNKEVETLCRMHDALEAEDPDYAVELLVEVGKAEGEEQVLTSLKKVNRALLSYQSSRNASELLTAASLLSISRKAGLCPVTRTRLGYVSDFLQLLGLPAIPKEDRAAFKEALLNESLLEDAHEFVVEGLRRQVRVDIPPLEMLELLVGDYASLDAWASYKLANLLAADLAKIDMPTGETLAEYYFRVTADFLRTLWNMERRGISLDVQATSEIEEPMAEDIDRLERDLVRLAGWDVNPNSPKQLLQLFFTKDAAGNWIDPFGEEPKEWTKGGSTGVKNPSTSKDVIAGWAERGNELAKCLVEHRALKKLHGTYITGLPSWTDRRGRIHTDLKLQGTVTGRLSSGDPNLQNIPARGDWGHRIRQLFVAGEFGDSGDWTVDELRKVPLPSLPKNQEMTLIVADYCQLEMRIMAHMSQDPTMIETIKEDKDLHSMTAALAAGYDYDEIVEAKNADNPTKGQKELIEVRAGMKAVGFGLLYGIGAAKLGRQLGLPLYPRKGRGGFTYDTCPKAQELIDTYFEIYPNVRKFINETHDLCEESLYVNTLSGRFRRLPDILSREKGLASQAKRQSVNSIIQGSAADIAIAAMLNCEYSEEMRKLGVRMLLQIHDELVFEVPKIPEVIERAKELVRVNMEDPIPLSVPILISMDEARTWGDAK